MDLVAALGLSLLGTGYYLNKPEEKAVSIENSEKIEQKGGAGSLLSTSSFDQEILGVFSPQYFDTKNTFSQNKRSNPAYNPQMIYQNINPQVQALIKNNLNLDQLRQKRHKFPEVLSSVTGILQSHGNGGGTGNSQSGASIAGVTGFSGSGSGSNIDSGQQAEIPHQTNIDRECDLTHNNMVPFYGSRVKQSTDIDNRMAAGKLELYTGQYHLNQQSKQGTKALFPPTPNLTNVNGSRDCRDLSRYFPNNTGKRNNELPFEQIYVGPGLNQGFTSRPSGGVHDQIRILPKRNEELYVNPKTESKGKIIYGKALVDERTSIGAVYKYRPELLVDNRCGQRNFTTVGEVRAPTVRSGVVLKTTERSQLVKPLINHAKSAESNRSTPECLIPRTKLSNRQNFKNTPYRNTHQVNGKRMNDHGKSGYQNKPNERSATGPNSFTQAFRSLTRSAKNIVKGWEDKPKYTRKQEYVLHPRPYGNLDNAVYKGPVYDPNNTARTTIRETTEDNQNMGSVSRGALQNGGGYQTGNWCPKNTQKQFTSDYEYTGIAGAVENKSARLYDAAYNAELNIGKEEISRGRSPTQQSVKLNKGKGSYNIQIKRIEADEFNQRVENKDSSVGNRFNPNAIAECTLTSFKNNPQEDYHRLDPTLLEPFKHNGLTQSLHSY